MVLGDENVHAIELNVLSGAGWGQGGAYSRRYMDYHRDCQFSFVYSVVSTLSQGEITPYPWVYPVCVRLDY